MKELPYFKFYTNEWITGDITFLDYETQGLFINLCAYYWSKDATLTLTNAKRKFKDVKPESFELLIESDIIKINEDNIIIKFLDEQRGERGKLSTTNSLNGSKGGRPKKQTESENKPTALILESETLAKKSNIEEKREEEKREEETIKFDFKKSLISYGFDNDLISEWMKVRKAKKAVNTETAFKGFISEVKKSNKDPNLILKTCVERSWSGFKIDWLDNLNNLNNLNNTTNEQLREITAEARRLHPGI